MIMTFYVPDFETVDSRGRNICGTGRQDFTLTRFAADTSNSGNDMMVIKLTADNGDNAGHSIKEYIVFGLESRMGEAKLKRILECAGSRWEQRPDLNSFVAQFPENKLRVSAFVEHAYSIKEGNDWVDVPEERWEDYDGKKHKKAVIADGELHKVYQEPQGERTLVLHTENGEMISDDDLPF